MNTQQDDQARTQALDDLAQTIAASIHTDDKPRALQLKALAAILDKDNATAFKLCRKLDPVQLQDLGLACQELERMCETAFYLDYGGPAQQGASPP